MSQKLVLVEHGIDVHREQKTDPALRPEVEAVPSPQDTLPNDVLAHIFVLVSQDHGPAVLPIRHDETPPQLVLSHVCSRWRALALSTFELWNNVCLVNRDDHCVGLLCHEWLSRVGSSPIELSLLSDGPSGDDHSTTRDDETAARTIQDTVSYFKLQIKMLHIYLTCGQLIALSSFPNTILPHIEKLQVKFGSYDVEEAFSSTPISFPRLRSVVICDGHSFRSLGLDILLNISLPWSQLRCLMLHFKARYLIPVLDRLRQMPLLQELHLFIRSDPSHHLAPLEELTIPGLRCFCLKLFIHPIDINKLLRSITCPALVELDINRTVWSKEIIKQQYNLQGLEELTFLNSTIPASSILQDAPKLRRLWIRGNTIDDEAIAGLANGTLGRHIRELTIDDVEDVNRFLSMVEMRKRTVDRLIENGCNWREMITVFKEVNIYGQNCNDPKCGHKERIDALEKVGITVWLPEMYLKS